MLSSQTETRSALLFRSGLADDQVAFIVDREPGLARFIDDARVPVYLSGIGSADDRDQSRIRIIAGIAKAAIDADRNIDDVPQVEGDLALAVAFERVDLASPFEGQKDLLGRVPMKRRPASIACPHIVTVKP